MMKVFRNIRENLIGGVDADYYPAGEDENGLPIGEPLPYTLTPEEVEDIDPADITPASSSDKQAKADADFNAVIQSQLDELDKSGLRAMREMGLYDTGQTRLEAKARLQAIEDQAKALRSQLR